MLDYGELPFEAALVPAPEAGSLDRSGWVLSLSEFEDAIRQALAGDDPNRLLTTLMPERIGVRQIVDTKRFVDLIVEAGAADLLTSVLEKENFTSRELGVLLSTALELFDRRDRFHDDLSTIDVLLSFGANPQPDEHGFMPQCSI